MKGYSIEQLRDLLTENVLEVVFEKKNGEQRRMLASTNALYIPEQPKNMIRNPYIDRPSDAEVLTVVDTEIEDGVRWRAIRFDSIKTFFVTDLPVLEFTVDEVT